MPITPQQAESVRTLTLIEAFAEIMKVPPAQLALILARARKEMGGP